MLKKKLPGSILMYVVFIIILVTLLFFELIHYFEVFSSHITRVEAQSKAIADINSALLVELNRSATTDDQSKMNISEFLNDSLNPPEVNSMMWGLFKFIRVQKMVFNKSYHKLVLCGNNSVEKINYCLYLVNKKEALYLTGNSIINGNAFLPAAGVKTTHLSGSEATGKPQMNGQVFLSDGHLPFIEGRNSNPFFVPDRLLLDDTLYERMSFSELQTDTIINSFSGQTIMVESEDAMFLSDLCLHGNVILYSESEIIVYPSSSFMDIILIAPIIKIKSGFSGILQCFASDSLIIEENCHINMPSILCLHELKPGENKGIMQIKDSSVVEGIVLGLIEDKSDKEFKIVIEKSVKISGLLYCEGGIDLKGEITGKVCCDHFVLNTPSSKYINYIEDAMITQSTELNPIINILNYDSLTYQGMVIKEMQ